MIEVNGLSRFYGNHSALIDVSFSIQDREIVGFLGLNGAGKTTALKLLAGLLLPSAGSIRIQGVDAVADSDAIRGRIGFLPEDPPLYTEMRVDDFLTWCGAVRGVSSATLAERLPGVLATCQITSVADRVIDTLSHGFRKRVGIAQAIIHQPELVILDEPISGLDPVQIVEMRKVIQSLKEHCTVLLSSHILSEVHQTCDRLLVLNEGRLVAEGTEEDLSQRAATSLGGLEIVIRGERARVETVLSSHAGVQSHEVTEAGEGLIHAVVKLTGDHREALAADLVTAGLGLRKLDDAEGELEEIFLRLTSTEATTGGAP